MGVASGDEEEEGRDYFAADGSSFAQPRGGYLEGGDLLQPLTLLNTPMGLSGDVIRRTFTNPCDEGQGQSPGRGPRDAQSPGRAPRDAQ